MLHVAVNVLCYLSTWVGYAQLQIHNNAHILWVAMWGRTVGRCGFELLVTCVFVHSH